MAVTSYSVTSTENGHKVTTFWSLRSFRLHLCVLLCLSVTVMASVRHAFGLAMVCMVNSTSAESGPNETKTISDSSCHIDEELFLKSYDGTLSWSAYEQSVVFSAIYYGGIVAGIPIGWLTNTYSPKLILMGGFGILFASSCLTPVAATEGGVIATFVVRFVQGMFSQVLFNPVSTMLISYWIPMTERSTAMSLSSSGNQIAMVIGPPINAWLCRQKWLAGGWPFIFYSNALFSLFGAVFWWIFISDRPQESRWISDKEKTFIETCLGPETSKSAKQKQSVPWRYVLTSMPLVSCYLCAFANGLMLATLSSYIPTYYRDALHLDLSKSGLLSAAPFLVQWITKMAFSIMADNLKRKSKIDHKLIVKTFNSLGTFGTALFLIACGYMRCTETAWAVFFLTMANAAFSGLAAGYITTLVCVSPSLNGVVNGIARFCGQIASVAAPYIVGGLTVNGTASEWRAVFYVMSVSMIVSGVSFLIFGQASIPDYHAPYLVHPVNTAPPSNSLEPAKAADDTKVSTETDKTSKTESVENKSIQSC